MRDKPISITTFDGEKPSKGGEHYTHPFLLDIGTNGHRSKISCEVAKAGQYDLIIPFGWWYSEHTLNNIDNPSNWVFEDHKCQAHVEHETVADLFE